MKIKEIYIDGFKNIKDTRLVFDEPVLVLLSPNNYGKTNLLKGITWAFKLLRKAALNANLEDDITGNGYTSNSIGASENFTFEVLIGDIKYGFIINHERGVIDEYLISRGETSRLHSSEKNPFKLSFYDPFVRNETDVDVFRALTTEDLGVLVCDEETSLEDAAEIGDMTEKLRKKSSANYDEFKDIFKSLFPQFKDFYVREVEKTGRFEPFFINERRKKTESWSNLSYGTRRIFRILLDTMRTNRSPLIGLEELETGIHPSLYCELVNTLAEVSNGKNIITTSHSPTVMDYFEGHLSSVYMGENRADGLARFRRISSDGAEQISKKIETVKLHVGAGTVLFDSFYGDKESRSEAEGWLE